MPDDQEKQEETPSFVTKEELEAFGGKISSDLKAMFGRVPSMVSEQLKSLAPNPESNEKTKDEDPNEKVAALLKTEREALSKRQQQLDRQQIRSTLESALIENGAEPKQLKIIADSLMMRNNDKLAVVNSELGESKIVFKDNEYEEGRPISDFIKSYLKSEEGSLFMKKKESPSLTAPGGKRAPKGDLIHVTRMEAAKMDPEILKSGRVRYTD